MAKRFVVPFAATGDKSVTPDATDPGGAISYSQGWPVAYQLADTDPAYRPVGRQEMNGVFNDITGAIAELQTIGFPEWVAVTGLVVPYRINAYVRHNDVVWKSLIANNSDEPGVGAGLTTWFNASAPALIGHGQCRLAVGSTTTLTLKPYNGNNMSVNGATLQLPAGGVTYTLSGLAASTVYYVYLAGTTAAPVLNVSTTAYVTGSDGVVVKSGDPTQTLVGMVSTNASTQFVDTALVRTCLNWFNRRKIIGDNATQPGYTFTNTTSAEINTALRITFLCWADDVPFISTSGTFSLSIQGTITLATSVDTLGNQYTPSQNVTMGAGFSSGFSGHGALGLTEGRHFTLAVGSINVGGTATLVNIQTIVQVNG